ncbi:MAG TPA: EpsI family protein, partial [Vicinamibacterales bacterium]|nr:EpsI family protein [Vicinamibacterales bacterium]
MTTTTQTIAPQTADSPSRRSLMALGLAVVAIAVCYAPAVVGLVGHWATNPLYSFGFAVPLISGYLVWTQLPELKALGASRDYAGGWTLLGIGALMMVTGYIGGLITVQQTSLVVVLAALVLMFFGRAVFARVWFPIAYLIISIPVWSYAADLLQSPSRRLSAELATVFLRTLGIPALREGTRIVLPNVTLEVLRECSGVNQLITFTAMALPAAYLFLTGTVRRAALVVSGICISYLTNGVRITLVGWLAYHGLSDGKVESLHLMEGLAVSAIGYIAFGACLSLLSRGSQTAASKTAVGAAVGMASPSTSALVRKPALEFAAAGLIFALAAVRLVFVPSDVALAAPLSTIPTQIAEWRAVDEPDRSRFPLIDDAMVAAYPSESGVRRFEGIDDEIVRTYRTPDGDRVRLYVGYLRSQHQGKELAGQASSDLARVSAPVTVPTSLGGIQISRVDKAGQDPRGLVYWYDLNGRIARDTLQAKQLMLRDAITRRR